MDYKVICCDIDGTLVRNDKTISEENKYWIKRACEEKDVKFVLSSGRMLSSLLYYKEILGVNDLTVSLNGAYLTDPDNKVLKNIPVKKDIASTVVDVKNYLNTDILCISGNKWYVEGEDTHIYQIKRSLYMKEACVCNLSDSINNIDVHKFVFINDDKNFLLKIEKELRERIKNLEDVTFYPGPDFLEVMAGGVNKGSSLKDIADYYNVDINQIMSIGDDLNDIEMLRDSGLGVAMANAFDEAKQVCDFITTSNEEDGVAKAIEKFIFEL